MEINNADMGFPHTFKDIEEKKIAFEQYRILTESLNKTFEVRIQANNFWTTINGAAISALAYMKDTNTLSSGHKSSVLWTLIIFGLCICLSWISYLTTIMKQIEVKNKILMKLEKYFPIPLFKNIFTVVQIKPGNPTLTIKEMLGPLLFIAGYLFFAILLFFFTDEVTAPTPA